MFFIANNSQQRENKHRGTTGTTRNRDRWSGDTGRDRPERREEMNRRLLWALGLILLATVTLAGAAHADWGSEETQVYCYIGDRNDNEYLGTVDVFDASKAAAYCNMLYGDCRGSCTGCFTNQESREVCVTSSGMAYFY
jgi:hypothetical protein